MKRAISLLIILTLLLAVSFSYVKGEETDFSYTLEADKLELLGLFIGTDIGYMLDRAPTRAEAGVMLVRLLGKESDALGGGYAHPFTDVPEWVDRYVGFLYVNGLTKGIGNNLFDPNTPIDAKSYITFILRALGYSEEENDFRWEDAIDKAYETGLINKKEKKEIEEEYFDRGLMAALSYNAMNTVFKGGENTLAYELIEQNAMSGEIAVSEDFYLTVSDEVKYMSYLDDGEYTPYLIGVDRETALIRLRKSGVLSVDFIYVYDEIAPAGTVTAQSYYAYTDIPENFICTLTLSKGPTLLYHVQLTAICEEKGWSDEIIPYVVAASKYLITNTVLSKYDVFKRLYTNIENMVILSYEESADIGFAAVYDPGNKSMYINRYMLSEEIVLHELIHAICYFHDNGKLGFHQMGVNTRNVTEGFTEFIAESSTGKNTSTLNTFRVGSEEIIFSSGTYYCSNDKNYELGVFSPLFILTGKNSIERMFFQSLNQYSREVLYFDEKYGESKWETLWMMADAFTTHVKFLSESDRNARAEIYMEYLDGIIECLETDLELAVGNMTELRMFYSKLTNMKNSFPLQYNDYREKLLVLEKETAQLLEEDGIRVDVPVEGKWIVPDYIGKQSAAIYNNLTILGAASGIGYSVVESDMEEGKVTGIIYKNPDKPEMLGVEIEAGDELKLGGIYIITISAKKNIPSGYSLMRDFVGDFSKYIADYENLEDYVIGKLLKSEGIDIKYEFIYMEVVDSAMKGRIVGQFPQPDTALISGGTTVIIYMLEEK